MYRSEKLRDDLKDCMDSDGLWDERKAGMDQIADSANHEPLPNLMVEAYLFGYTHGKGWHYEEPPESESGGLLEMLKGLFGEDVKVEVVVDDEQPPIIPA